MIEVSCPACREVRVPRTIATFPFCSEACRDHDLSAWTEERYKIAGEAVRSEDESEEDLDL